MLNDVSPDESNDAEEDNNYAGKIFGTSLTVELLKEKTINIIFECLKR